jgi:hypothetical protein
MAFHMIADPSRVCNFLYVKKSITVFKKLIEVDKKFTNKV